MSRLQFGKGFPHHKHLSDKVAGAEEPSILKVIEEAKLFLTKNSREGE